MEREFLNGESGNNSLKNKMKKQKRARLDGHGKPSRDVRPIHVAVYFQSTTGFDLLSQM